MPCYDPFNDVPTPEEKLAAKMPAVLCSLTGAFGPDAIINSVNWKQTGITKEDFQKWWELHKASDAAKNTPPEDEYATYYSDRGIPLLYVGKTFDKPMITLENYDKWYNIFLVMPDGSVKIVDTRDIEIVNDKNDFQLWIDHLYHPRLLYLLAKHLDAYTDIRSLEVAAGRWMTEYVGDDKLNFHDPDLE